jgi:hypothetical protein
LKYLSFRVLTGTFYDALSRDEQFGWKALADYQRRQRM